MGRKGGRKKAVDRQQAGVPNPQRWYNDIVSTEEADRRAVEDAERKTRKKLRQKGEKLRKDREERERQGQSNAKEAEMEETRLRRAENRKRIRNASNRWVRRSFTTIPSNPSGLSQTVAGVQPM